MVAPSFALFAKGGNQDGIRNLVCADGAKSWVGGTATAPFGKLMASSCKKRKDGAPSAGMVQARLNRRVGCPREGKI
jgi:hypothetical protein